jgi:ADP-ribosyl-[dinitrogen reductase] hydrolase
MLSAFPPEFKPRERFAGNPVTGMTGCGTHGQPAGTWSDDGSLTPCLLDSLSGGYDNRK